MTQEQQPNPFLNHPKAQEYVARIKGGADLDKELEGSPDGMRAAVQEMLKEKEEEKKEAATEKHPADMDVEELESFIAATLPAQYRGLSAEALEVVWSVDDVPYFAEDADGKRRQAEIQKRALVIAAIDTFLIEAQRKAYAQRLAEVGRRAQIAEIKRDLVDEAASAPVAVTEKMEGPLTSSSLDEVETYHFESPETGVSVTHTNKEHGQDAFAVNAKEGVCCVSDGASSYGKSGPVSAEFSRALAADAADGRPFDEIFSPANMTKIAETVKASEAFKSFNTDENPHAKGLNKEAGLATVVLTRANKENKTIEWASVGDSPLMVLDVNPDGSYSFEIVNDDVNGVRITDKNFTTPQIAEALGTPETHLIGIGKDGNPRLNDLKHMRQGSIEYKPGRVVILASDFLTKMMALSPQMIDARIARAREAGKEPLAKAFEDIQAKTESFDNPLSRKQFKPELLFDGTLSAEELKHAMEAWKEIPANNAGRDDMTAVTIKMDEMFAEPKEA